MRCWATNREVTRKSRGAEEELQTPAELLFLTQLVQGLQVGGGAPGGPPGGGGAPVGGGAPGGAPCLSLTQTGTIS